MHLFDQRILGVLILLFLGVLVIIKKKATGSVLDRLQGSIPVQLANGFNLFFAGCESAGCRFTDHPPSGDY